MILETLLHDIRFTHRRGKSVESIVPLYTKIVKQSQNYLLIFSIGLDKVGTLYLKKFNGLDSFYT